MLIDEVTIEVKGGKGGDGKAHFDMTKSKEGADGGNGGNGGSVFVVGVSDLAALNRYRHQKKFKAGNGVNGGVQKMDGKYGEDIELLVPIGTIINNLDTGTKEEILKVGEKIKIASGGKGGRGNVEFKSSRNTSPYEFEQGKEGEEFKIFFELQLIAQIGFVGLPNVGKSSMLNELTAASARVANYKFTTLEPNLGVLDDLIIADIPGLIEGASEGKGLGFKFLRHIQRTRSIVHFISCESEDPKADYETVKKELESYDPELAKKEDYIFLTKHDLLTEDKLKEKIDELKKISENVLAISIHDEKSIQEVRKILKTLGER